MPYGPWVLDSGGFSELQRHGRWRWTEDEYDGMVTRFSLECGDCLASVGPLAQLPKSAQPALDVVGVAG